MMKTASSPRAQKSKLLRAARLRKHISLVKASDDTQIRRSVLQALESGDTDHLPDVYLQGLIETYSSYLGLSSTKSFGIQPAGKHRKQIGTLPARRLLARPVITSSLLVKVALALLVLTAFTYAGLQTYRLLMPPRLTIHQPDQPEILIRESSLVISGRTSQGVDVFIGRQTVLLEPDGSFEARVSLRSGLNDIEVRAVNTLGKATTKHLTVVFVPPIGG